MRAGFLKPTRTSSDSVSASVIVALKRPVRLCLGRWVMIFVKVPWNPKSRSLWNYCIRKESQRNTGGYIDLSASSIIRTSSSLTLTEYLPLPSRNSSILPGVPTTMSEPVDKKRWTSWPGEERSEDIRSKGSGYSSSEPSFDCGWELRKRVNKEWIWEASSLQKIKFKKECENYPMFYTPGWSDDQCPNFISFQLRFPSYEPFQNRDHKCKSFTRTSDCFDDDVFMFHKERYCRRLYRSHLHVTHRVDDIEAGKS